MIDLTYTDLSKPLFHHRVLASPLRQEVIAWKDGLRHSFERVTGFWSILRLLMHTVAVAWKIRNKVGKVTHQNAVYVSTHRLLDYRERFQQIHLNGHCDKMIGSAFDILTAINESDSYYRYIFSWVVEQMAKDTVSGRWPLNTEVPKILRPCWNGGK